MKKIGILSDTHGLLRQEVKDALAGCDAILHGGDINMNSLLAELREIAPVYVVRGNNDKEWAEMIPNYLDKVLFGVRFFMTHKKKDLPEDLSGYDLVVCGHTHKYDEKVIGQTIFLNPGSCGPRRFDQAITLAVAEIREDEECRDAEMAGKDKITIRKIDIPHPVKK